MMDGYITASGITTVDVDIDVHVSDLTDASLRECLKEARKRGIRYDEPGDEDSFVSEALSLLYRREWHDLELLLIAQIQTADALKEIENRYEEWLKSREAA